MLAVFAGFTWYYRLDPTSYAGYMAARRTADWLRENTKPEAVVAGWDVGIVGGYSKRSVENLDGLINSWNYKENYFDKGKTQDWIDAAPKVDYVAQYFQADEMNPKKLSDYRGVDLLNWRVVFDEKITVRSWSNLGKASEEYYVVLATR